MDSQINELAEDINRIIGAPVDPVKDSVDVIGWWNSSLPLLPARPDGQFQFSDDGRVRRNMDEPSPVDFEGYYQVPCTGVLLLHESRKDLDVAWMDAPTNAFYFAFSFAGGIVLSNDDTSILRVLTPREGQVRQD